MLSSSKEARSERENICDGLIREEFWFLWRLHIDLKHVQGDGVKEQTVLIALIGFAFESDSDSALCLITVRTEMIEQMISVYKMIKEMMMVIFLFRLED